MSTKISSAFRARLDSLPPKAHVRAIVILDTTLATGSTGNRLSAKKKTAAADETRELASTYLDQLDEVLESCGGSRLQVNANVLGTILVETTAKGVEKLARIPAVKAVMEDQRLSVPLI